MSERIVVFLIKYLLDEGREIIIDNWYMSLKLAEFLLSRNTYVTGTIRSNRGVPKELTTTPLIQNQSCFIRKGDVLIVRYKDKRDVYLLTTKMTGGFTEKPRFDRSVQSHIEIKKPAAIEHYNKNMGSVDGIDQDIEPYDCTRKSYTWFKKIGLHIIQRMVLNAKVLYVNATGQNKSILEFTKILIDALLTKHSLGYNKMKKHDKTSNLSEHIFVCSTKEEGARRKRSSCRVCYEHEKKRKYTSNICSTCPGAPIYLCSKDHFDEYHNK